MKDRQPTHDGGPVATHNVITVGDVILKSPLILRNLVYFPFLVVRSKMDRWPSLANPGEIFLLELVQVGIND